MREREPAPAELRAALQARQGASAEELLQLLQPTQGSLPIHKREVKVGAGCWAGQGPACT